MAYLGNQPNSNATINKREYTSAAGQTVFNVIYDDYVEVYLNGSRLSSADFTAEDGFSITLTVPASLGDILSISGFQTLGYPDIATVDTTDDLGSLTNAKTAIVRDLNDGGIFIYDSNLVHINDGNTIFDGWVRQLGSVQGGQFLGTSVIKAVQYMAQTTGDTMTVPSGTNAFSVDSIEILDGGSITVEDGAVFKVL